MTTERECFEDIIKDIEGRHIVLDLETTGLDYEKDHTIEIAAIEIINGVVTGKQFHSYIKPRKIVDKGAQVKNRLYEDYFEKHIEKYYEPEKKKT